MPSPPSPHSPLGTKKAEKIRKILKKIEKPADFRVPPRPSVPAPLLCKSGEVRPLPPKPIEPVIEVGGPVPGTVRLPPRPEPPPAAPTFGVMTPSDTARTLATTVNPDVSPLDFLLAVVRKAPPEGLSPEQVLFWEAKRLEAAKAAAPFIHGKQSVSNSSPVGKTHEEQLEELAD